MCLSERTSYLTQNDSVNYEEAAFPDGEKSSVRPSLPSCPEASQISHLDFRGLQRENVQIVHKYRADVKDVRCDEEHATGKKPTSDMSSFSLRVCIYLRFRVQHIVLLPFKLVF